MDDYCCHGLIKCPACWTEEPNEEKIREQDSEIDRLTSDNNVLRAIIQQVVDFEANGDFTKWPRLIKAMTRALEGASDV